MKKIIGFTLLICFTLFAILAFPEKARADTIYWEDNFQRADGAVANGWDTVNSATGQIASNILQRTDSGAYRILYNPTGVTLPADYYVTVTVPHATIGRNFWGLIGRYSTSGGTGNGTGLKVFWQNSGANYPGVGTADYDNNLAITVTGGFPTSWSVNQNHQITLQFAGTKVTVYLDGQEYGYFNDSTNNQTGTAVGLVGDGGGTPYYVLDIKVTDYLPAGTLANSVVSATTGTTTATVTWQSNGVPADSLVEYGLTTSYGGSASNASLVTSHSIPLTGLLTNTIYHYRVTSKDALNNTVVSSDNTFLTKSATGTVYWEDDFHRANGTVGNNWTPVNSAVGQIVSQRLQRTDGGAYRILYNPTSVTLPANYYVTMTVPHSILSTNYWGLMGRYVAGGGNGTGLKIFWQADGANFPGVGHADFSHDLTITATGGIPASWSVNQNHLITMGFNGTTTTVYLDGQEYGYFTDSTNNQTGTGVATVGDGGSGGYFVYDVIVTDYLPGQSVGISSITATPTDATATITWNTTESSSNSKIDYGTTTGYGSTQTNASLVTSHSMTLTGLTPNTLYHYKITSVDANNFTMTSSDQTFTTPHHIYADEVTFETTGSSFAANITVDNGATILWTFEDSTTSSSSTPSKNYGSSGTRVNRLKVTPWSALRIINVGYDGGDGGTANTPYLAQQNVIAVYGMNNVAPYLEQWTSSNNPLTSLDFSNFVSLTTIECFNCQSITSVNLTNTPQLTRLDLEDNNLSSLNLSQSPLLADLRGAVNNYSSITWGTTGAHVWHICIRDNPQMTTNLANLDTQFPVLSQFWVWNSNQSGPLHITSTSLSSVLAYNNHYTSADFSGTMPAGRNGSIDIYTNSLTSIDVSNDPGLTHLDAHSNSLGRAAVDTILQTINSFNTSNGTLNLSSNSVPSNNGYTYAASLTSRGWTVTVDSDATAPTITAFSIPSTGSLLGVSITSFTATDNSGVTGYYVSESGTTPTANDAGWSASVPTTYTFGSFGAKTLYAWTKDYTGNISARSSATITLTPDTTAPVISSTTASPGTTTATITWTTDEIASSKVEYGLTTSYGTTTSETDTSPRVTSHTVSLSSLIACSTYHFRARSTDASTNERLDTDMTFTTSGCTGSATVLALATSQVTTSSGGSLALLDSSYGLSLTIPSAFGNADADFQAHKLESQATLNATALPGSYGLIGSYLYELRALTGNSTYLLNFDKPITVDITYSPSTVGSYDVQNFRIFRWDGSSWQQLSNCSVNTATTTVSCTTTAFSVFGLFGTSGSSSSSVSSSSSSGGASTPHANVCENQFPGPKAPWIYGALPQSNSSVLLYFTPADKPVSKYVLQFGTAPNTYQYGVQDLGVNSSRQMTFLVRFLKPRTRYYFRIRANNGCAPGAWSNEATASTAGPYFVDKSIYSAPYSYVVTPTSVLSATTRKVSCHTYTVKRGDSLWSIAAKELGNGAQYSSIADQNRARYPALNHSTLQVGWKLRIGCE